MKLPPAAVQAAIDAALAEGRAVVTHARPMAGTVTAAPARPEAVAGLKGKAFEQAVIDLAHSLGWRVASFRPVRIQRADGSVYYATPVAADGEGFADLELVRERLVKIELKSGKNVLEPAQEAWRDAYLRANVEWHVFRPADWSEIVRVLT